MKNTEIKIIAYKNAITLESGNHFIIRWGKVCKAMVIQRLIESVEDLMSEPFLPEEWYDWSSDYERIIQVLENEEDEVSENIIYREETDYIG